MRSIILLVACSMLTLVTTFFSIASVAAATITPSDVYLQYRAALVDAKDISAVAPLMTKSVNEDINHTPEKDKPMMFGILKSFSPKTVQILSEKIDGEKAVLTVSGDPKEKETGTVSLLRENGLWKIEKESWKASIVVDGASTPAQTQK